jgi:peptidyl-prolyl cis-trans isomerase A (cyclophilin A)
MDKKQIHFMRRYFLLFVSLYFVGCSAPDFNPEWTKEVAPATFVARFETSKGNFDIEVIREWSPKASDRFFQLVTHHFYDKTTFYRVVPDYVAQFGNLKITDIKDWGEYKVTDEPVVKSNQKGTVSFARSGKDDRGNHVFINLNDNQNLDTANYKDVVGYPVFGRVIQGMDVVESLCSKYGDDTMDRLNYLSSEPNEFFKLFPELDGIKKAYLLK